MPERAELEARADEFLTRQLPFGHPARAGLVAMDGRQREKFSPFNQDHAERAFRLTNRFMELVDVIPGDAGLEAVLDEAERVAAVEDADLVKYALMSFITHDVRGAGLPIPPLERRAPQLLPRPPAVALEGPPDPEAQLDWYRRDVMVQAHHEHWHVVYPWQGIPDGTGGMRTQDRQGELFLYMHQQVLARYDTERLAVGLGRVKPLSDYRAVIPEGYDHGTPEELSPRPPNMTMADLNRSGFRYTVHDHELRRDRMLTAVDLGRFETATGSLPVDITRLGNTEESNIGSASARDYRSFYGNHHGMGHFLLGWITDPTGDSLFGPMLSLSAGICDPVFYRWHKHVDDIAFRWQELQPAVSISDAPKVLLRKGRIDRDEERLITGMHSPDIILCFKDSIPDAAAPDFDGDAYGQRTFGGENWDKDFSGEGPATGELQTMMLRRTIDAGGEERTIDYLDQREFFYFLRVENLLSRQNEITVRIFLVRQDLARDRRMWIEMDKFRHTLQPNERKVIFRPAAASSVIQKPAEKPPRPVEKPAGDADYCTCGWPYNLLLPRGTKDGMPVRLMAMATDWAIDQVAEDTHCGSMSFCGARDRYPDTRPMGYPFHLPLAAESAADARDPWGEMMAAVYNTSVAARDVVIRWTDGQGT